MRLRGASPNMDAEGTLPVESAAEQDHKTRVANFGRFKLGSDP
jgi:hypothetical protein